MTKETKRQKQVAGLINEELNDIFRKMGLNMIDGGMVSIGSVKITPDLFEARVYLSMFQVKDVDAAFKKFDEKNKEIRKERKNRLQLFGIALFLVNFFAILIIISRKRKHPPSPAGVDPRRRRPSRPSKTARPA